MLPIAPASGPSSEPGRLPATLRDLAACAVALGHVSVPAGADGLTRHLPAILVDGALVEASFAQALPATARDRATIDHGTGLAGDLPLALPARSDRIEVMSAARRASRRTRRRLARRAARWPAAQIGPVVADLDRFKAIYNALGLDVGDTLARIGGDAFVVFLEDVTALVPKP